MTKKKEAQPVLPPISLRMDDVRRLTALANSSEALFPRVAHFLERELERASKIEDGDVSNNVVHMGSQVRYCDDKTGEVRDVVLVYPHEADITLRRVSVLTPVGAALLGLSVGQTIEFNTPGKQTRTLTVLGVCNSKEEGNGAGR